MSASISQHKPLALRDIRHVALDMDGTIYRGTTLFRTTAPFLSLLSDLGIGFTFITNNPSKSVPDYLKHLAQLGLSISENQIYTSTQATIEYLREQWPEVGSLFILGTPSMCQEFQAAGFALLPDDASADPDAVVVASIRLSATTVCVGPPGGSAKENLSSRPIPTWSARPITHSARRLRRHLRCLAGGNGPSSNGGAGKNLIPR